MLTTLRYGPDAVVRFDLPAESVLFDRHGPPGEPLDDPAAAVAAAAELPLDFPPLAQATTPDDRVALALAPGVPQAEAIVAGLVYTLSEAGIAAENISIVVDPTEAKLSGRDITQGLPEEIRQQIQVIVHDPAKRDQLSYLSASSDGQAVYFNREICDADFVIPIACMCNESVLGQTSVETGLFPAFADEAAQRRYFGLSSHNDPVHFRRRTEEAHEAAWLLGVMFTVAVLPGADGTLQGILCGERRAVADAASTMCQQAWAFKIQERASLVIATVEGGSEQQTWENFGRALNAASEAVVADGAIVVCTDMETPPGPSLQRLMGELTADEAKGELQRDKHPDTLTAARLLRALDGNRVYLLSRLPEDVVESLGMAYVASEEEIVRLSTREPSCILLRSAQFTAPQPND